MTPPLGYLKPGDLAYVDAFAGLLPCRIISVSTDTEYPTTATTVQVQLTATRRGYRRGETLTELGIDVIHRRAVRRKKYGATILGGYGFRRES